MPSIHLIEGPVGAGKSTYALKLSKQRSLPWLNLDQWMTTLFSADRPEIGRVEWYLERKARCLEQIWKVAQSILDSGASVILELGLIRRADRLEFFKRLDGTDYSLCVHVMEADESTRRERVKHRNLSKGETYAMEVADEFFTMANNLWEPVDDNETDKLQIIYVNNDK